MGYFFFKPTDSVNADMLASSVPALLEGDTKVQQGAQIRLGQESVDCINGEILWNMSLSWYEKRYLEGWSMSAYRTDLTVAGKNALYLCSLTSSTLTYVSMKSDHTCES